MTLKSLLTHRLSIGDIDWKRAAKISGNETIIDLFSKTNLSSQDHYIFLNRMVLGGNHKGICVLGMVSYHLGFYDQAAKWLGIADSEGILDTESRFVLVAMYMNGEHFPRDFGKARELCVENARLGHSASQFILDHCELDYHVRAHSLKILWLILRRGIQKFLGIL